MILIAPEGVHLECREVARSAVQEPAGFEDLLEEERVRPVDHGQVDGALREVLLQVGRDLAVLVQRRGRAGEQDGEVEVARRVLPARGRGSELQEQPHAVPPRERLEVGRVHDGMILRGRLKSGLANTLESKLELAA